MPIWGVSLILIFSIIGMIFLYKNQVKVVNKRSSTILKIIIGGIAILAIGYLFLAIIFLNATVK